MIGKSVILAAFVLWAYTAPVLAGEPFVGTVKSTIDGDSLLIVAGRKTIEVRLYGVDCPEYNQPFSKEAKALVRDRVHGQKVLIQPEYYDSYRRLVALVTYGGQTLNGDLVKAGLAWVSPRYCRKKVCASWERMERSARDGRRGLWRDAQPVSPWIWKRTKSND